MHEIINDYLLILAKVTLKQCLGVTFISDSKMQSASCVSVKCESNNFRVASCHSGDLRVGSCELWVNNQAVSWESYQSLLYQVCITGLHYTTESNLKIGFGLNGNELEIYASIYRHID